jgi:hypothetical protein
MVASFFTATSPPCEADASRFLPARFHARLILGLAGWAGVILHAGVLLVAANFAAWLLGLCRMVGAKPGKHQKRYREDSHEGFPVDVESGKA